VFIGFGGRESGAVDVVRVVLPDGRMSDVVGAVVVLGG
jgi:hypothetical protein